ncbi:hypothetical protein WSM22_28790 [Cytophagales bacterium WSM2-2]|nr:hypothetical protein WSM22_28790 [Cytophagales bacterium WSM2-2]
MFRSAIQRINLLCACVIIGTGVVAQVPKKIREFSPGKVENVSVDRLGNFFLVFKNGTIKKYDPNGKLLAAMSKETLPTLIEPWFHPKIFVYHRDQQRYAFFDHNIQEAEMGKVDPSVAVNPWLVCPTNDNKLLVLDKADWSIKKVTLAGAQVLTEFDIDTTSLASPLDFTYMREYQNLIFLLEKNSGIYIYSNLGKRVNSIKTVVHNFGFFGEELFYLTDDKVIFYDLYSEKSREIKLQPGRFMIVTDERIILVNEKNRVLIFEFISGESEGGDRKK